MKQSDPRLLVQSAPLLQQGMTTPRAMRDVIYALIPVTLVAVWYFGLSALLVVGAAIAGAVLTEWLFSPPQEFQKSMSNHTTVLTGLLLGLILPPGIPLWMAFLGGVISIGLGKTIWGGLGQNLFNPALVGRAFLGAAFPTAMTTWTPPRAAADLVNLQSSHLSLPFMRGEVDAVTSATPLGLMKFEQQSTPIAELIIGNTGGSLGETSAAVIVITGVFLLLRRDLDWRIPASILITVFALSSILFAVDSSRYADPLFAVCSGSLLFGAIFMATDPVTSPMSPKGAWIFGIGIGVLVVLIRTFGGFPEGVMYAILLMNAATPLIDRYTQPRVFGSGVGSP